MTRRKCMSCNEPLRNTSLKPWRLFDPFKPWEVIKKSERGMWCSCVEAWWKQRLFDSCCSYGDTPEPCRVTVYKDGCGDVRFYGHPPLMLTQFQSNQTREAK